MDHQFDAFPRMGVEETLRKTYADHRITFLSLKSRFGDIYQTDVFKHVKLTSIWLLCFFRDTVMEMVTIHGDEWKKEDVE
ncbi:hypothetical protein, partial [Pontibacterium sinense]|uniref:hypothetical protein n=1 Tax=Pontibacterium sinense TaxID=2781979 RepID=UPI001D156040